MAEYSGRPTRGRFSNRGRRGSTQGQSNLGISTKTTNRDGFCASDSVLMANIGENHDGELNGGSSTTQLLHQAGQQMDLFKWCEQCGTNTEGDCFIHGSVITVSDNKLPSRARLSLPSILSLEQISEGEGREGVFAKRLIQPRTQFGPLEAAPLQAGATLPPGVFDVRVLKSGIQEQLDLSQEEACNWMMFVRPAQCAQETNLAAYQQAERIYYISTKTIHQKTELRVWYFPSYGQQIGKDPLPDTLPPPQVFPENSEEADGLSSVEDQEPSMMTAVGTRQSTAAVKHICSSCNVTFRSATLLWDHNCRVLDDAQSADSSSRPARRKSRPRKVAGVLKKGKSVTPVAASTVAGTTTLPSVTTLIKTEIKTEVAVPDSTVSDLHQEVVAKKRGRPKGSKNKPPVDGEVKPPRKPPTNVKRQRAKLECHYCDRSFYSEEQHRVHESEHTGTKPYVCQFPDCGKGFGTKFKYQRHCLVHDQPQNRKCTFCERRFNRVDHLKNHIATHNSNRQFWSCEKCGKQYLHRSTYDFHMAMHDAKEGSCLVCSICSKSFTVRKDLIVHVKTHNRYKPDKNRNKSHKCTKCEKTFTTSKDVRRHMVTHTKDRAFLCDICPQTFARRDHLRRHKRSNHKDEILEEAAATNIISHCCATCLQSFKTESHLRYHLDTAHAKNEENSSLVKLVTEKPHMVMDPETSKVLLMHLQQSQQQTLQRQQQSAQQQQQLNLLSQATAHTAAITPMQLQINQHHQQQDQPQQPQQILLQAGYITTLPAGTEGQTVEVVADSSDQYNPTLPFKTIPYRFSTGQVLATAQSAPTPTPVPISGLRQILSNVQSHQQHQQQTSVQQQHAQQQQLNQQVTQPQPQPIYTHNDASAPTMLASSCVDHSFLDLAAKGQMIYTQGTSAPLKPLHAQWVLAGNNTPVPPDTSTVQTTSDSGDHCYATGITTTNSDGGLKQLPSLPSLTGKVINTVAPTSDDSFRMLGYQVASGVGGSAQPTSTQATSSPSLQASWDSIPELTIPLQEIINPLSASQASIINLPVTVNVPSNDGSVNETASVTLSQST